MLRFASVFAAVAVAVTASAAFADSSPKTTGGGSSPGAAPNGFVPFKLNVTAQGTPAGAKGNVTFTRADGTFAGSVTCYDQVGNKGSASGPIESGNGIFTGDVGEYYVVIVQDNGEGAKATGPDQVQVDISSTPIDCAARLASDPLPYAITDGNFQVH